MINSTPEYKAAIIGDSRRMYIKAKVHVVDPDIVYGTVSGSSQLSGVSRPAQLYDGETVAEHNYITLEPNRWLLDGTYDAILDLDADEEVGFVCSALQNSSGENDKYVELAFSGVGVLNACTIAFPDNETDGYPVNLTVEIYSGATAEHTATITGNTQHTVTITGFSVTDPTSIKVTVTKWSLPDRRVRVMEIVAGVHEEWSDHDIAEFTVVHQGDPSAVSLPYGTANITFDNTKHTFDPYNKLGLFDSLEERQGIDLFLGVGIDGVPDYKKLGTFFQYADGWKIRSGLTITWSLVDIIGLLANRAYIVPSTLPTTLEGWIADLVSQLGANFTGYYDVTGSVAVTASAASLVNETCGQVLTWLCQATQTWPVADPETGKLKISPLNDTIGNTITLANQVSYPTIKANNDIARIDFVLANGSQYSVQGNVDAATVITIRNPFINTTAKADATADVIKANYGGNRIETIGRGDPTSELGDIVTVETEQGDVQGRLIYADYKFQNGVLTSCISKMTEVSA